MEAGSAAAAMEADSVEDSVEETVVDLVVDSEAVALAHRRLL